MESPPAREFGKRRPAPVPAASAQPVKRSRHVALLVMGTLAIGGSAYALMPGETCEPKGAGMAAPSLPQSETACAPRGSSSSGGHGYGGVWSRSSFFSGDPSSNRSSSGSSGESGSGEVTRGGFGGFARAFAAHFSGGG
jgi:hypothetical protein